MSTRCTVHFYENDDKKPTAIVYRHHDGGPYATGPDLHKFMEDNYSNTKTRGPRTWDPSILAARLVVYLARELAYSIEPAVPEGSGTYILNHANVRPLDFIGVGVVTEDPEDIEYRYTVRCRIGQRPEIHCYKVEGNDPHGCGLFNSVLTYTEVEIHA